MIEFLKSLPENPAFGGVLAAGGIGMAVLWLTTSGKAAVTVLLRQFTVEMQVRNEDATFHWLATWLAAQDYAKRARRLRLASRFGDPAIGVPDVPGASDIAEWLLSPGLGLHWFLYRGRPVWFTRAQEGDKPAGHQIPETFTLRTIGRDQGILRTIISDAYTLVSRREGVELRIWQSSYWAPVGRRAKRGLDSIVLPEGQIERIVADARWFFDAKDWYVARGVPYRRGYLFAGVPGSGKTSLVLALASHFDRPIYILNIGDLMSDGALMNAMSTLDPCSILLLEDIDAVQSNRQASSKVPSSLQQQASDAPQPAAEQQQAGFITMSGLLNAIDGLTAAEGRLLIMTTNYPDRLDPALVRGGRVDMHERFGLAGPDEIRRIFALFYPDAQVAAAAFRSLRPRAPADLQAIFMRHADDPNGALEELLRNDQTRAA